MRDNKGFLEINSVEDYWKKLQWDFQQLKEIREDTYLAFNFFVTAYHLVDWIFEGKYPEERKKLSNMPFLKISGHIANGIKHFHADKRRHKTISKIEKESYVGEGYTEEKYVESPIIIYLEGEFDEKESIEVFDLAVQVMENWKVVLTERGYSIYQKAPIVNGGCNNKDL